PGVGAAGHTDGLDAGLILQGGGGHQAAGADGTHDVERAPGWDLLQSLPQLTERDVGRAGDVSVDPLVLLPDVEHGGAVVHRIGQGLDVDLPGVGLLLTDRHGHSLAVRAANAPFATGVRLAGSGPGRGAARCAPATAQPTAAVPDSRPTTAAASPGGPRTGPPP